MISGRGFFDHRSKLLKQQPKKHLALMLGPAPVSGDVGEDGTGGAAVEARHG